MKAIVATEVRAGDTVRIRKNVVLTILTAVLKDTFTYEYHPKVHLVPSSGESVEVDADSIVELIHRPWPGGEEMAHSKLQRVQNAMRDATRIAPYTYGKATGLTIAECFVELSPFRSDDALQRVLDAIEEYLLGEKPGSARR